VLDPSTNDLKLRRLRMHSIVALGTTAAVLTISAPGATQDYDQLYRKCYDHAVSEQVVVACTFVIAKGSVDEVDLATAYKNRGDAYDDQGKYDLALEDYGRAIATNPQDADALNSRGTTKIALKQYVSAVQDFDASIKLNPSGAISYSNRCFAKAVLGDLQGAMADCDQAMRISGRSQGALASRGFVYLLMKKYDAAIADYSTELKIQPDDPYALYGRGIAKYKKGDLKGADHDFVQAQALKADIVDHMAGLGIELGKF
jgi:tetratricopeptide (TPR) repeat protein